MENEYLLDLFDHVKQEAAALKKYVTAEEIAKLDPSTIQNTAERCVYGQMTGDCNSERAFDLIQNCCERVYDVQYANMQQRKEGKQWLKLNGSPKTKERRNFVIAYMSPIESLLALSDDNDNAPSLYQATENIKNLIAYLKGETDELILTEEGMIQPQYKVQ
jgi:hypothetical protein